jgi:hypothetical protein
MAAEAGLQTLEDDEQNERRKCFKYP